MADNLTSKKADSSSEGEFEFDSPTFTGFDLSGATDGDLQINDKGEHSTEGDGEFIIPDTFDFGEEFPASEYVSTLRRPYVPRFTEVTENNNYFADQSAVKAAKEAAEAASRRRTAEGDSTQSVKTDTAKPTAKSGKGAIVVERVEGHTDPAAMHDRTDPTAQIESYIPATVVVNVKGGGNAKNSTINVFKFPDGSSAEEPEIVDAEELERRGISDLTGHQWQTKEEAVSDEAVLDADESEEQTEAEDSSVDNISEDRTVSEKLQFPADYDYLPLGYEESDPPKTKDTASEYNSFSQHETFKDRFLDSLMATRIRLVVAILLGLVTVAFELFSGFFVSYLGLSSIPNAPMFIDSALIAGMIMISIPELIRGITLIARGIVTPEFNSALSTVFVLAYTVYLAAAMPENYIFVGTVYSVMTVDLIVATLYMQGASFTAFKAAASKGVKAIVDCRLTRNLDTHNHALDGLVDEYRSKCAKAFDTLFVSGFFGNNAKGKENTKNNLIVMSITFGVAVVLAIAVLVLVGIAEAFAALVLVVCLATPALSTLSHKLPFYYAERAAVDAGGCMVGEASMYDASGVDVMVFEDVEVFGPDDVTLKSASDKRSTYHESMRKLSSLFNAVGGPLSIVFESALGKKYEPANEVSVYDGGIVGVVDGKQIIAGTAEFMSERGISVPVQNTLKIGSTRIVYAAEEGEFFGTFTVHYSFSEEFALMLSNMKEKGIVPLVYTRDFNIDNQFMRGLTGGSDVIRVMKKYDTVKEKRIFSRINASVISAPDKTAVLDSILRAKRYTQLQSTVAIMEIAASAAGAALAVAVTLCKMTFALPMLLIAAWQIAWGIVLAIMSIKNFTTRKKENYDA